MQRIEAGLHLHLFDLLNRRAVRKEHTALLQLWPSIREFVLDDKILRLLCVDKRRNAGLLCGEHRGAFRKTILLQHLFDRCVRARRDFVDHAPRERNLRFILYIRCKPRLHASSLHPLIGECRDGLLQFLAVPRAVVRRNHGDRFLSCPESCIKKRDDFSEVALRLFRSRVKIREDSREQFSLRIHETVSLLRNREGAQLQGFLRKNLLQPAVFFLIIRIEDAGFCNRSDHRLFDVPIRTQCDQNREIIVRAVLLLHDFIIVSFRYDDSASRLFLIQHPLRNLRMECAENIAGAEVNPDRILSRRLNHRRTVKLRELIPPALPFFFLLQPFL